MQSPIGVVQGQRALTPMILLFEVQNSVQVRGVLDSVTDELVVDLPVKSEACLCVLEHFFSKVLTASPLEKLQLQLERADRSGLHLVLGDVLTTRLAQGAVIVEETGFGNGLSVGFGLHFNELIAREALADGDDRRSHDGRKRVS